MNEKEINLIRKLVALGFTLKEANHFIQKNGLAIRKPWIIFEQPGISVVNDYALNKIIVI